MSDLRSEISRRRTFAIISHPDAGKTTLTEKFLLYGGAIAQAGEVKGASVPRPPPPTGWKLKSSAASPSPPPSCSFSTTAFCINILDTPGHQDFSEDTYRTLMAADSAVMVIDGAKGVEPQTRKLFKVCALRHIPHLHLYQQDGPGDPGPAGTVRRSRAGAGHRHLCRQLAHRLRQGIPGCL